MNFTKIMLRSVYWVFISKVFSHSVGLITLVIMARVLNPYDFGIAATATIVTNLFEILSKLGTSQYLIQKRNLTENDINTAWSIQLIMKIIISLLIFNSSDLAADYFEIEELSDVLKVLALVPIFNGLNNISIILCQKEMNYKKITNVEIAAKVVYFSSLMLTLFLLRNYWASILATLVQSICVMIISYVYFNRTPKFTLYNLKKQFSFSQWTLFRGLINYFSGAIDKALVTKFIGVATVGAYGMTNRLLNTPNQLLMIPLTGTLYSGISLIKNNNGDYKDKIQKTILLVCIISLPISLLMIILSESIVYYVLGGEDKWTTIIEILPLLAPTIVTSALSSRFIDYLTMIKEIKIIFSIDCFRAITNIVFFYIAIKIGDISTLAIYRSCISTLFMVILFFTLTRKLELKRDRLFKSLTPIIIINLTSFIISYSIKNITSLHNITDEIFMALSFTLINLIMIIFYAKNIKHNNSDWMFIASNINSFMCLFLKKKEV